VTYFVIDQDGVLHRHDSEPSPDAVREAVGPEGCNRVQLSPEWGMTGWANDCGLILPRYRRNIVGSCLLATFGAVQQPYGGPLVVTGYDPHDEWFAAAALDEGQAAGVESVYADVRNALHGATVTSRDCGCGCGDDWATGIRAYAEVAATGETPSIQLVTPGDAGWPFGGLDG
jgi:hypothetical protein